MVLFVHTLHATGLWSLRVGELEPTKSTEFTRSNRSLYWASRASQKNEKVMKNLQHPFFTKPYKIWRILGCGEAIKRPVCIFMECLMPVSRLLVCKGTKWLALQIDHDNVKTREGWVLRWNGRNSLVYAILSGKATAANESAVVAFP